MLTLYSLIDLAKANSLTYNVITPTSSPVKIPPLNTTPADPNILFLLNFTTAQRTALLTSTSTRALLYTPTNEHFGIGPVEAMCCGVPVLACNSGGPTESVVSAGSAEEDSEGGRTGWLCPPDADAWALALEEILGMSDAQREQLGRRAKERARTIFGMEAMAKKLEDALREVVGMGKVQFGEGWRVWIVMLVGFIVAYAVAPWVLPR